MIERFALAPRPVLTPTSAPISATILGGVLALALLALPLEALQDAPSADGSNISKAYRPGHRVPGPVTLEDVDGREHTMLPEQPDSVTVADDEITIVVFWSLYDPVARGYVDKLTELQKDYEEEHVRVFLVNSNHDEIGSASRDPLEKLRSFRSKEAVTLPILIDYRNEIADQFGAISNAQAYLIGYDRTVRYVGAIDDDPRGKLEQSGRDLRHHLRDALGAVLATTPPDPAYTRPAGRQIKREPK